MAEEISKDSEDVGVNADSGELGDKIAHSLENYVAFQF